MKPLALLSALYAAAFLRARAGRGASLLAIAAAAVATVAGSLAKPSFVMCLVPAVMVVAGWRLIRKESFDRRAVIFGLLAPAIAVLGVQYLLSFSGVAGPVEYQDSIGFAPFKVMGYFADGLAWKLALTILFPLSVYILYWPRARRDTALNLAFLLFVFGAGYAYLLAETVHWSAGNLIWSGYITAFVLFVFSALFYVRQVLSTPLDKRVAIRHLVCLAFLILHVQSGIRTEIGFLQHWVYR